MQYPFSCFFPDYRKLPEIIVKEKTVVSYEKVYHQDSEHRTNLLSSGRISFVRIVPVLGNVIDDQGN
jgi:hypothetical protein